MSATPALASITNAMIFVMPVIIISVLYSTSCTAFLGDQVSLLYINQGRWQYCILPLWLNWASPCRILSLTLLAIFPSSPHSLGPGIRIDHPVLGYISSCRIYLLLRYPVSIYIETLPLYCFQPVHHSYLQRSFASLVVSSDNVG